MTDYCPLSRAPTANYPQSSSVLAKQRSISTPTAEQKWTHSLQLQNVFWKKNTISPLLTGKHSFFLVVAIPSLHLPTPSNPPPQLKASNYFCSRSVLCVKKYVNADTLILNLVWKLT